ncbi:unnamed protein product [Polarella glacialis]|uniref:ADP,ATP carrier protein n=1 Tax=Polarella glacialis TaxID=89957 RepID=A0A813KJF6_POLGL|nr:unnamed protein product [Polarella glacialis]
MPGGKRKKKTKRPVAQTIGVSDVTVEVGQYNQFSTTACSGPVCAVCGDVAATRDLVMTNSMPLAFIVLPKHIPLVMTLCNCLFDASAVMFLLLYRVYAAGVERRTMFVAYALLCAVVHIALSLAWCGPPAARLREAKAAEPPLHGLPLKRQLCSFEFAFAVIFLSLQQFRSNTYLGTNKEVLEKLGDASTGYFYTQAFSASLPASLVCVPLISRCLRDRGFADTFLLTSILGILWNGVALVQSLPAQLVSFAAFTNFRAFLYSAYFTFVAHSFGSRTSASVSGVIGVFSGSLNFMIWPCTELSQQAGLGKTVFKQWLLVIFFLK